MKRVFLGLGTNLGDRKNNIMRAIDELSHALGKYISLSSFMESEPWGFASENIFLNCVVSFDTTLNPLQLLNTTEEIERRLGRTTKSDGSGYHDRLIDIDILFYGDETIKSERLTIPHPLLHKRDFVLRPLAEIEPQMIHPVLGKSIEKLCKEFTDRTQERGQ